MSRKRKLYSRVFQPDSVYKSIRLTKFINKTMIKGKKSTAEKIVYAALVELEKSTSKPAIEAFNEALKNVTPLMEVKSRRVGGSTYQVPIEVPRDRGDALAMKWLIHHARKRKEKSMKIKLAMELKDAFDKTGTTFKKKEESHKMAESNKAFAHFRW